MELWIDAGDDFSSSFTNVTGYNGQDLAYGFTAGTDGLSVGKTYRIKTRSINAIGASSFSDTTYVAFGAVAGAPGQPQRVTSTRTSITVNWTAPSSVELPITGYILNMDDGVNKDLAPVYIGSLRPDIT